MSQVGQPGYPAGNSLFPTSSQTAPERPAGHNNAQIDGYVGYKSDLLTGRIGNLSAGGRNPIFDMGLGRASNVGLRHLFGRYASVVNPAAGDTYHNMIEIPVACDAVQLVLANIQTSGTSMFQAAVTSSPDVLDIDYNTATDSVFANWSAGYKSGSLTVAQITNPTAATRPTYLISDPVPVQCKARTDGIAGAVLHIRVFTRTTTDTTGSYSVLGNGGTDAWIDQGAGSNGYRHWCRKQAGQAISPWSAFTSTTASQQTPLAGIIYYARGKVINVTRFGDSIADGRGTLVGDGYLRPSCVAMNAKTPGAVWECSNHAWAGTPSSQFDPIAADILTAFPMIDVAFMHTGSPNDVTPPITQTNVNTSLTWFPYAMLAARKIQAQMIPVTWCPTNPSTAMPAGSKDYGSSDSLRRAYNANVMTNQIALDLAGIVSGAQDGNGQTLFTAGLTTDGTHPNDAGNALISTSGVIPILSSVAY